MDQVPIAAIRPPAPFKVDQRFGLRPDASVQGDGRSSSSSRLGRCQMPLGQYQARLFSTEKRRVSSLTLIARKPSRRDNHAAPLQLPAAPDAPGAAAAATHRRIGIPADAGRMQSLRCLSRGRSRRYGLELACQESISVDFLAPLAQQADTQPGTRLSLWSRDNTLASRRYLFHLQQRVRQALLAGGS